MAEQFATGRNRKEDILRLIDRFARFGATLEGGIHRLAASEADKEARDYLCQWLEQNGFATLIDPVGNIFGILELKTAKSDRSFYCGSHLDSQPNGGRFDGTVGVVFACVAALAIKDLVQSGQIESTFERFVVACWTSEEGARFQPSLLGSSVFTGNLAVEDAWDCKDGDGVSLKDALVEIGYCGSDTPPKAHRYLEVHIEQGTRLDVSGYPIGLVQSSWGARKIEISITGKPDHTGPTPMDIRKDALLAASKLIVAVNDISTTSDLELHSSVGRIEVTPNSPNTVAGQTRLWIEFRSPNEEQMDTAEYRLNRAKTEISLATNCRIDRTRIEKRQVVSFNKDTLKVIADRFEQSGTSFLNMTTIAGHDALTMQSICPSSLLFVPSKDGISHAPEEYTSDEDLVAGFDASLSAITALISQPLAEVVHG